MELTRIDTDELKVAVDKARKKVEEALQILDPHLVRLTDKERATTLRARDGFIPAARTLVRESAHHPQLAAAVDFDAEAVTEDLDNVEVLGSIENLSEKLHQLVADSRLRWLAEAYQPSLQLYGVAKVAAKQDGALRTIVDAMAEIFPGRGKGQGKGQSKEKPAGPEGK